MSVFDAAAYAIIETTTFVIGRIFGRTFHIEQKRAHEIGGQVVFGVLIVVVISVTFIYS
jgi:membrane protein DedA with SNARE-associated domain